MNVIITSMKTEQNHLEKSAIFNHSIFTAVCYGKKRKKIFCVDWIHWSCVIKISSVLREILSAFTTTCSRLAKFAAEATCECHFLTDGEKHQVKNDFPQAFSRSLKENS